MSSVTVAGLRNVRRRAVRARRTRMDVHTPGLQQDSAGNRILSCCKFYIYWVGVNTNLQHDIYFIYYNNV